MLLPSRGVVWVPLPWVRAGNDDLLVTHTMWQRWCCWWLLRPGPWSLTDSTLASWRVSLSGHSLSGYSFLESSCYAVTSPQHIEIPLTDTLVNSSAELSAHSRHELPPREESPWISFLIIQSLSHVWLFATPWTAVHQASLSFIISRSLLNFVSIESVTPSNHLILCHPLLLLPSIFPSIRVFSSKLALHIRWPKYGASALASVFPVNIQGWFPLGLTSLISLQSKGLSRVFSS